MKWEDLTSNEFDKAIERSKGVCVIPLGCLEKHGEHLVTGCDSYASSHIAELAAQKEYAVIFPAGFWLGEVVPNHSNDADLLQKNQLRGYISIKPKTLLTILEELCDEIHRNGFNKILIVNGHGGNRALLDLFTRGMLYEKRDYAVMWTNLNTVGDGNVFYDKIISQRERFDYLTKEDIKTLEHFNETGFGGGHADFSEVAFLMGQNKKYVRPEKFHQEGNCIHRFDHLTKKNISFGGAWMADHPKAFSGYAPIGCTETIGKAFCEIAADNLAEKIKAVKEDTECLKVASRKE
jgi:creatinine amidohydrolase